MPYISKRCELCNGKGIRVKWTIFGILKKHEKCLHCKGQGHYMVPAFRRRQDYDPCHTPT